MFFDHFHDGHRILLRLLLIDDGEMADRYRAAASRLDDVTIVNANSSKLAEHASEVDAVVITSSVAMSKRTDLVRVTAELAKPVLVNTPGADSKKAWEQAVQSCRTNTVPLLVSNPSRYMAYPRTVKQSIVAEQLGKPGLVRVHHWMPSPSTNQNNADLNESVLQQIDLVCWLCDAEPDCVYATPFGNAGQGIQVHLGFSSGCMALIDCSFSLPENAQPYYSLTVVGSSGAAYADDHRNTNLVIGDQTLGLTVDHGHDWIVHQLTRFLEVIESKEIVDECHRAFAVTQAAWKSLSSGQSANVSGGGYELS